MLDFQHITQRQQRSSKKAAAEQSSRSTGSPHPASEPVENALEQDGKQRAVRYVSGRRRTASNAGELLPPWDAFCRMRRSLRLFLYAVQDSMLTKPGA